MSVKSVACRTFLGSAQLFRLTSLHLLSWQMCFLGPSDCRMFFSMSALCLDNERVYQYSVSRVTSRVSIGVTCQRYLSSRLADDRQIVVPLSRRIPGKRDTPAHTHGNTVEIRRGPILQICLDSRRRLMVFRCLF